MQDILSQRRSFQFPTNNVKTLQLYNYKIRSYTSYTVTKYRTFNGKCYIVMRDLSIVPHHKRSKLTFVELISDAFVEKFF